MLQIALKYFIKVAENNAQKDSAVLLFCVSSNYPDQKLSVLRIHIVNASA